MRPAATIPALVLALAIVLRLAAPSAAAQAEAPAANGPEALLRALWTPEQLAGRDADRLVGANGEPDATHPDPAAAAEGLAALSALGQKPARDAQGGLGVIRRVPPRDGRKVVALTFDLCERANNVAGYNNLMLNLLRRRGLKATFFAGGKWMRSHPEAAMQLMADPRFEVGSHTWTHGNLAVMTPEEIDRQMRLTQAQYALLRAELVRRAEAAGFGAQATRVPGFMRVMRLPYGRSSQAALSQLAALGYPVIQWDVEGERAENRHSGEELARRALAAVRPGSIVLLHANAVPKMSLPILEGLVEGLEREGYETVTVGELLGMGRAEVSADGYFTVPGDNLEYDTVFPGKGTLRPDPTRPYTTVAVP